MRNHCSAGGAQELRQRIADFWAERGAWPTLTVRGLRFHNQLRESCHVIESDMINGLPRELCLVRKRPRHGS